MSCVQNCVPDSDGGSLVCGPGAKQQTFSVLSGETISNVAWIITGVRFDAHVLHSIIAMSHEHGEAIHGRQQMRSKPHPLGRRVEAGQISDPTCRPSVSAYNDSVMVSPACASRSPHVLRPPTSFGSALLLCVWDYSCQVSPSLQTQHPDLNAAWRTRIALGSKTSRKAHFT